MIQSTQDVGFFDDEEEQCDLDETELDDEQ